MIKMWFQNPNRYFPVFVCDVCQERIAPLEKGNFYWESGDFTDSIQGTIGFAHKGCDQAYNRRFGRWCRSDEQRSEMRNRLTPVAEMANELDFFILQLILNHVSPHQVKQWSESYHDLIEEESHPCEMCGKGKIGTCSRCNKQNVVVERHHFAPRSKFSDPDNWPTALLCEACHDEWHKKMG